MSEGDRPPRLTSVVPFLYGVADRSWLPGSVLVQLLVAVGAPAPDASAVVARMRADGSLSAKRRGREVDFELAGLVRLATGRARAATDPDRFPLIEQPSWEGSFAGLLYAVPKTERRARARLRSAARLAGYAPLRTGLMISLRSSWTVLADVVADLPAPSSAQPVTLGMKTDDARQVAAQAWRLDRVGPTISAVTERLEQAAEEHPASTGVEALRSYARLALPAHRILVKVPVLPAELIPADWPLPAMITALRAVRDGLGAAAEAYAGELLSHPRPDSSGHPAPAGE